MLDNGIMSIVGQMAHIEVSLKKILKLMEVVMAKAQDFKDLVDALNAETDMIAARIDAILAKLQDTGLSSAEEAQALSDLQAVSDRLKTLGTDQTNPIP